AAAERIAVEGLRLFRLLQADKGECRSRERSAHALVALGRPPAAAREARRAWRSRPRAGGEAAPEALLALRRGLLRAPRAPAAARTGAARPPARASPTHRRSTHLAPAASSPRDAAAVTACFPRPRPCGPPRWAGWAPARIPRHPRRAAATSRRSPRATPPRGF